jgi:hypothetical protein
MDSRIETAAKLIDDPVSGKGFNCGKRQRLAAMTGLCGASILISAIPFMIGKDEAEA